MRTGEFTRVRYLRISRMCLEIVNGLTEQAKAVFLDQCLTWFLKLEQGESIEMVNTGNPLLNLALREEISELQEGFDKYMQAVEAAKKAKANADVSPTDRRCTADVPPTDLSEQTKKEDIHIQTIDQIKTDLIHYGYKANEIESAYRSVDDWTEIGNPSGYIRKIIDNERKRPSKKTLPAQNFPQRDYSDVNKQLMDSLAREMKEFKKGAG